MRQGRAADADALLKRAEANFDIVLASDPTNGEAMRGKAKIYRRMAERAAPAEKGQYWDRALGILTDMIRRDDRAALAYYNRSCYEVQLGRKEDALADLQKALQVHGELKEAALADPDFAAVAADPRFRAMTGQAPQQALRSAV